MSLAECVTKVEQMSAVAIGRPHSMQTLTEGAI